VTIYRVTPLAGVPCLRHGTSIARATARALAEFPAGLQTIEPVSVRELAVLVAGSVLIPVEGRRAVEVFNAVQRERARVSGRFAKAREAACEKAQQKKAEEAARRAELKAQAKAERAAEKKRAERAAQVAARAAAKAAAVDVQSASTRPPWEG